MHPESVLRPHHLDQLTQESGISAEVITARGYRSITGPEGYSELKRLGFSQVQARNTSGLLIPLWTVDGRKGLVVYRPDNPRLDRQGRIMKYEIPTGASVHLDCPPTCRPMLADPAIPLWITEGQKKGDALVSHGLCAIDLIGVWNFKGKNDFGGTTILADWDHIALKARSVRIVFDSDVMTKRPVRLALNRLTEHLQRKGAHVTAVYLPPEDGQKIGVDDYLRMHPVRALEGLTEAPRPEPQPAAPIVELLEDAPRMLTRPLALIDGCAYAATWLWTSTTTTKALGKDGAVTKLPEPQVRQERRLFVMRGDGVLFGDVSDPKVCPLRDLGMTVRLPDPPRDDLLWRAKSVVGYRRGARADVRGTFARVISVYNHFVDFSRSLHDQPRMCRFSACCSSMTWFADAFTVLPYPWANSAGPGSGKTKWGHCWVKTAYLGYLTSAAGSFAALRDLADMGATIAFDDAEALADPKVDPDKQALVLTGNRKGASIPVKEAGPDGRWHTRWLNAYCPRGFTALRLPFPALQSRSVVIPLVASADPCRANRDPENPEDWPVDQRELRDDLWALALALQHEAAGVWSEMSKETSIVGRDWERWRALVAVGRLFERHGVDGLERDVRAVMAAYHEEKGEIEGMSRVVIVIQALMRVANLKPVDVWTLEDVSDVSPDRCHVTASQVVEALKTIVAEDDTRDDEPGDAQWYHSTRSVGRILSKLRLKEDRDKSTKRERHRITSAQEILQLALAHHIVHLSGETSETSGNGQTSEVDEAETPSLIRSHWEEGRV